MKRSAVALIDGEHYPPVVVDALRQAADRFEFRAALFLGGTEKVKAGDLESAAESIYGLPVLFDRDWSRGLTRIIERFRPEVIVDLSDEPVLGYEQRFRLVSETLARNVGYAGSDFHFSPPRYERLCTSPSLSIIGTGKRVGKTAISGYMARVLQGVMGGRGGRGGIVIVAMGRGGPAVPEVIDGASGLLTVADLLEWSRQGRHAASDHFEDAFLSRVKTIGCRRCGGGLAGRPFTSNVAAGVELAKSLEPGLVFLEGSGAALPPVASDACVLVAGAGRPVEHLTGYLGRYRLLVSDALVLTMAEEPSATTEKVKAFADATREIRPGMEVVPVVLRPRPMASVEGRRVAFFTTAPEAQKGMLRRYLEEEWGCRVQVLSTNLADRVALKADLAGEGMAGVEMVLTEIKAAAIDVVAEEAEARGLPIVAVDNVPVEVGPARPGRLAELAKELAAMASERFQSRA
jgi:cyclic 2,3-diphosphoglycerate synthetase